MARNNPVKQPKKKNSSLLTSRPQWKTEHGDVLTRFQRLHFFFIHRARLWRGKKRLPTQKCCAPLIMLRFSIGSRVSNDEYLFGCLTGLFLSHECSHTHAFAMGPPFAALRDLPKDRVRKWCGAQSFWRHAMRRRASKRTNSPHPRAVHVEVESSRWMIVPRSHQ